MEQRMVRLETDFTVAKQENAEQKATISELRAKETENLS
jgi:hypothetical protein